MKIQIQIQLQMQIQMSSTNTNVNYITRIKFLSLLTCFNNSAQDVVQEVMAKKSPSDKNKK